MWLAGPIVWALHLAAVYGAESLACSRGSAVAPSVLGAMATLVALGTLAILVAQVRGRRRVANGASFMDRVAVWLGVAGMAGVIASYLPVLMIPACLPPA